jgi:hypothetical protein
MELDDLRKELLKLGKKRGKLPVVAADVGSRVADHCQVGTIASIELVSLYDAEADKFDQAVCLRIE